MFSPAHENESISLPNSSALKYKTVLTMNIKCVMKKITCYRPKSHLLDTIIAFSILVRNYLIDIYL